MILGCVQLTMESYQYNTEWASRIKTQNPHVFKVRRHRRQTLYVLTMYLIVWAFLCFTFQAPWLCLSTQNTETHSVSRISSGCHKSSLSTCFWLSRRLLRFWPPISLFLSSSVLYSTSFLSHNPLHLDSEPLLIFSFCQLKVTPTNLHPSPGHNAHSPRLTWFQCFWVSQADWHLFTKRKKSMSFSMAAQTPSGKPPWVLRGTGHRLDRSPGFRGSLRLTASLFHLYKSLSTDICKVFTLEIQHKIAWNPHVSLGPFKHEPSRIPKASPRVALASLRFHTESFSSFFLGTKGALKKSRKFPPFPISGKWKLPGGEEQK